ncbi:MAG: PQQ-binding-like beta-propeller repeat protein [Pseudomonadales bacterium]|nr:PQQ-binding-like beta-propeller repeat protein [Pseudomonadales bacterium]
MLSKLMVLLLASLLCTSVVAETPFQQCPNSLQHPLRVKSSGWSRELEQTRNYTQLQAGLNAEDLPKLELQWAFVFADTNQPRSLPAITRDAIFIGSQEGALWALDRESGCAYWRFQARKPIRNAVTVVDLDGSSFVVFGDDEGYAYGLNALTGEQIWEIELDDNPMAVITGSAVYYDHYIYMPVSSFEVGAALNPWYNCCKFRGSINKLNIKTGERLWKSYTIPAEPAPSGRNSFGVMQFGASGAAVWSSPTIDVERQRIYFGTGQNYSSPADDNSDALHAIDLNTGERIWHTQFLSEDSWNPACGLGWLGTNCPEEKGRDYDIGTPPMLITHPSGEQLLVVGQKSGMLHAVDPQSGEKRWSKAIGRGGLIGGIHWGMASDGDYAYVPMSDLDIWGAVTPGAPNPSLSKVDLDNGDVVWQIPAIFDCNDEKGKAIKGCRNGLSAALTLIPGAVLSPGLDGVLRAHNPEDGSEIWRWDTKQKVQGVNGLSGEGGTLDAGGAVVADGQLFINSGYGGIISAGGRPGNVFLVFGL